MDRYLSIIAIATLVLLSAVPGYARFNVREAVLTAPRDVLFGVDSLKRLDMLDYYESGMKRGVQNDFVFEERITALDDNQATIMTSASTELTIALLATPSDTSLLVIKTMALPAPDARVTVYDRNWQPLKPKAQLPDHNDLSLWLTGDWKTVQADVENAVPFITASMIYDPDSQVLTVLQTVNAVVGREERPWVEKYMKPTIAYKWNGKKWTQLK